MSEPIRAELLAGFSEPECQALFGFLRRLIQNTASMGRAPAARRNAGKQQHGVHSERARFPHDIDLDS
jgi:hypothetical protein